MRSLIERHKSRRMARRPQPPPPEEEVDPWEDVDPSKWRVNEYQFDSTYTGDTLGKEKDLEGSIEYGVKKFKKNPKKYVAMLYQSNMIKRPVEKQKYTYIYRKETTGFKPVGIHDGGWCTLIVNDYEQLKPMPDNELPEEFRDPWTDKMTYQGQLLHTPDRRPLMPGRGMGICDMPNVKVISDVDPSDIAQGHVGNCWLLSGISSLAEFDGAIKRCFRKTPNLDDMPMDGPNKYIITLWDLPTFTEVDYEIDERLPANPGEGGLLLGAKPSEDGELWVSYLEKALSIHCGGWDKIVGGQCTHAWSLLTGCKYQYTIKKDPKNGLYFAFGKYIPKERRWIDHTNSPQDGDKRRWKIPWPEVGGGGGVKGLTEEELFMKMCAWDDNNFIVGAGCGDGKGDAGLVDNHAYSVIECLNDVAGTPIDMLKVRNPWGSGEIEKGEFDDDGPGWGKYPQIKEELNPVKADDGIFWVTKKEFFKFFGTVFLSASDMTAFLED